MTITLQIKINDQAVELPVGSSLQEALLASGHTGHFAVAVNKTFIPKSQYAQTILQAKDCVDVLAPMQGG